MILKYSEIKEAVYNSYNSLHNIFHYAPQDTLYATIGDYDCYKEFSEIDEVCIYINFAILFYQNQDNFDFMKKKLVDIVKKENFNYYKDSLKEEFREFCNDLIKINEILKDMS